MKMRYVSVICLLAFLAFAAKETRAHESAPPKVQAAIFCKVLAFYTNLGSEPFTIAVIGAPEVAREFRSCVGKEIGKATLKDVIETEVDGSKVIYVVDDVRDAIKYTQSNKVLSITGNPALVEQGVTLGVGIVNRKPKLLLNLSSTKAEGIDWNPAILKVSSTIE